MVHESLRKMTAHTLQDRLALVTKVFGGRCGEAASSVSAASNDRPSTATAAFRPERPLGGVPTNGSSCSALFDACPCLAAMKVRPRSVGRRWTKPGGGNRETRRGRSVGAWRYGHLSAARSRRYAMSMVLRQARRVA